ITCIAKWKNALWVGCLGPEGLSKLEGNKLVSVKPNIKALFFDTRKNLVITTINLIADTSDGIKFEGVRVDHFAKTQADRPPMWTKGGPPAMTNAVSQPLFPPRIFLSRSPDVTIARPALGLSLYLDNSMVWAQEVTAAVLGSFLRFVSPERVLWYTTSLLS